MNCYTFLLSAFILYAKGSPPDVDKPTLVILRSYGGFEVSVSATVVARKGDNVTLTCKLLGGQDADDKIVWTKSPSKEFILAPRLEFVSVSHRVAGKYTCRSLKYNLLKSIRFVVAYHKRRKNRADYADSPYDDDRWTRDHEQRLVNDSNVNSFEANFDLNDFFRTVPQPTLPSSYLNEKSIVVFGSDPFDEYNGSSQSSEVFLSFACAVGVFMFLLILLLFCKIKREPLSRRVCVPAAPSSGRRSPHNVSSMTSRQNLTTCEAPPSYDSSVRGLPSELPPSYDEAVQGLPRPHVVVPSV